MSRPKHGFIYRFIRIRFFVPHSQNVALTLEDPYLNCLLSQLHRKVMAEQVAGAFLSSFFQVIFERRSTKRREESVGIQFVTSLECIVTESQTT
ncbi:hypothetical protein P8452_18768 [Trifolium repens]|nr:hypothetical protein P8452_18768 [Trifolium repens]